MQVRFLPGLHFFYKLLGIIYLKHSRISTVFNKDKDDRTDLFDENLTLIFLFDHDVKIKDIILIYLYLNDVFYEDHNSKNLFIFFTLSFIAKDNNPEIPSFLIVLRI